MGKKNKASSSLGRSLIKDRFGGQTNRRLAGDKSMLHTTEVQDGYDWGRLNLQSVTEESSFQEFLSTAELAGTEYKAEKLNMKFVNPRSNVGLLTQEEKKVASAKHSELKNLIRIPRRPPWTPDTRPEDLDRNEREHFLEWRRTLSKLQEEERIILTPYEKNLEFWRQLWRVVERSDVVVQIVDARNPLLFLCEDLELYVKEVSENKMNLILVNKADFLTESQRKHWCDYFTSVGKNVAFFSAKLASDKETIPEEEEESEDDGIEVDKEEIEKRILNLETAVQETEEKLSEVTGYVQQILDNLNIDQNVAPDQDDPISDGEFSVPIEGSSTNGYRNSLELLSRDGLIQLLKNIYNGPKVNGNVTTIGLVGYPNVGKSSTINTLLTYKKVPVSATPGKTKHFQTLYLDEELMLCDCPGLVMPSFVFTKAEMIINGILPIDQMRDHVPPVNLVSSLIPRHIIEDTYGIMITAPMDGEDPDRCPTAEELLNSYAFNRGFMTANGQPDNARAARYVLKDYMTGKLLYVHAPPGIEYSDYHTWPDRKKSLEKRTLTPREARAIKTNNVSAADIEKEVLQTSANVHVKGVNNPLRPGVSGMNVEKPWKYLNKHKNKKSKEKLRKVYSHLDQH